MSEHQEANRKRLGELVTDGYKTVGLTRKSLAPKVGISERSLYSLEMGERTPREATQRHLEDALNWRRGAIADILGLGPDADLSKVSLSFMQESNTSAWADLPAESDSEVAQRLNTAAMDMTIRLREKDKENADLRRELEEAQQELSVLRDGLALAADNSPNQGRELRKLLDSIEHEHSQVPHRN